MASRSQNANEKHINPPSRTNIQRRRKAQKKAADKLDRSASSDKWTGKIQGIGESDADYKKHKLRFSKRATAKKLAAVRLRNRSKK